MPRPTAPEVADRALILYALQRRAQIELALGEFGMEPIRVRQAEAARAETDRWLDRESLTDALGQTERRLLDAPSGGWPKPAIDDQLWQKEGLGVLLWGLEHLAELPPFDVEFDPRELDEVITRYGTVAAFRANGSLRPEDQVDRAWLEADAWLGATEGRGGDDARLASISAERVRALGWIRDVAAPMA